MAVIQKNIHPPISYKEKFVAHLTQLPFEVVDGLRMAVGLSCAGEEFASFLDVAVLQTFFEMFLIVVRAHPKRCEGVGADFGEALVDTPIYTLETFEDSKVVFDPHLFLALSTKKAPPFLQPS